MTTLRLAAVALLLLCACEEKPASDVPAIPAPQKVLRWKAKDGTIHYTDDPSNIPKGAKVEETEGAEIKIVAAPKSDASVAPSNGATFGTQTEWRERFAESNRLLAALETEVDKDAKIVGAAETNEMLEEAMGGDTTFENAIRRLKRNRAELERQTKAFEELNKNADLAKVPEDWRH